MRACREHSSFARPTFKVEGAGVARGFTLIELLVVMAIISVLLSLSAFAFRTIQSGGGMARSKDMLASYVSIARSYAVANHIETMLVVNPYNSRFELWHLNPPKQGGPWDPFSGGSAEPFTDGYAYAPIFDKTVGLPLDGSGRPLYAVFPVDYDDTNYRLTGPGEANLDNLTWAAICFDDAGRLVTRTRRIATRSYFYRNGHPRAISERNRLADGTPNLGLRDQAVPQPLVTNADTAITSTRGFVICDMARAQPLIGSDTPTVNQLVNGLLRETRAGRAYKDLAETILFDRVSGQPLSGDRQ